MAITAAKLATNPWYVDESTSYDLSTSTFIALDRLRWVGATPAGHILQVVDGDSNIIWRSLASGSNYVEEVVMDEDAVPRGRKPGFRVAAMQSGVLYVYYK